MGSASQIGHITAGNVRNDQQSHQVRRAPRRYPSVAGRRRLERGGVGIVKRWVGLPSSARGALCVAVLAAWLSWLLPVVYPHLRPGEPTLSAAQILARLGPLPAANGAPLLLRIGAPCACADDIPAVLPALRAVDFHGIATVVPYPWVVLDANRHLVYAGPALLTGDDGRRHSAAPLVQRLLADPQAPMILSPHCACVQQ